MRQLRGILLFSFAVLCAVMLKATSFAATDIEYKDMADRIREAVLGEVGSDARTMDDGTLSDNLDVLEKAMSDLDMTTINEKVFEMSDFGYSSPDIEKFMEELFTAIRDYDTDRFDSLIQEIRTHL